MTISFQLCLDFTKYSSLFRRNLPKLNVHYLSRIFTNPKCSHRKHVWDPAWPTWNGRNGRESLPQVVLAHWFHRRSSRWDMELSFADWRRTFFSSITYRSYTSYVLYYYLIWHTCICIFLRNDPANIMIIQDEIYDITKKWRYHFGWIVLFVLQQVMLFQRTFW